MTRQLLTRLSGDDDLGIPEIGGRQDLRILEMISARFNWLGSDDGWNVRFGRELNATDDKDAFLPLSKAGGARPVLEGKQIEPFRAVIETARYELRPGSRATGIVRRARLAYRDVASATNKLTLIAALIPPRAVTTHTLLCLKTPLAIETQEVLCGLLNSLVANYIVRLRVSTHLTVSLVSRLPVPVVPRTSAMFESLSHLVRQLGRGRRPALDMPEYAALQGIVAHLYGLSEKQFEHILGTFPLIRSEVRERVMLSFRGH
jgi:hypothetical protein